MISIDTIVYVNYVDNITTFGKDGVKRQLVVTDDGDNEVFSYFLKIYRVISNLSFIFIYHSCYGPKMQRIVYIRKETY